MTPAIYIGNTPIQEHEASVTGQFVEIDGELYYRIRHYDQMQPFFHVDLSVIPTTGCLSPAWAGLTAGRQGSGSCPVPVLLG